MGCTTSARVIEIYKILSPQQDILPWALTRMNMFKEETNPWTRPWSITALDHGLVVRWYHCFFLFLVRGPRWYHLYWAAGLLDATSAIKFSLNISLARNLFFLAQAQYACGTYNVGSVEPWHRGPGQTFFRHSWAPWLHRVDSGPMALLVSPLLGCDSYSLSAGRHWGPTSRWASRVRGSPRQCPLVARELL